MVKKILVWALLLTLCAALVPAQAENTAILGQPFPDFTVKTSDGGTFTLSEALQDKQAVLINLWAAWCPPCQYEFPFLNEAYAQRSDKLAVIALSVESGDSLSDIAAYKKEMGLTFPMGRDEDGKLSNYVAVTSIPTTIIVDSRGVARFLETGMISSASAFLRVIDPFLDEEETENPAVLTQVPPAKEWRVTAEDARAARITHDGKPHPHADFLLFASEDGDFLLRMEWASGEPVDGDFLYHWGLEDVIPLESLYDPDQGAYLYRLSLPKGQDYLVMALYTAQEEMTLRIVLARGEQGLDAVADQLQDGRTAWEYIDE